MKGLIFIRPPYFPMMIDLNNKLILIVGGGKIASRRADTLLKCGAKILAISPKFCNEFPKEAQKITREFLPQDINSKFALIIAATDNHEVNQKIYMLAKNLKVPVNICDDKSKCDFYFPSLITHDSIAVSVCTAGYSAKITKKLSDKLRKVWEIWVNEQIFTVL